MNVLIETFLENESLYLDVIVEVKLDYDLEEGDMVNVYDAETQKIIPQLIWDDLIDDGKYEEIVESAFAGESYYAGKLIPESTTETLKAA
ncbi:hypothetical protein [Rubellicoccus peritrichatus]|uniref:Uncharacterized protein n=1 Tax=Rubellicoccus peritrichatus TaxID=3080537 RepID=A0AAQ3LEC9_9BACT|nr:hypothetical protein [Puniceicoccus sp. CR14]WOO43132.1 hypothetical protein RZN69_08505 [Puniceicoccus sp. CR14]